jgi:hypothetical protein
MCAKRNYLRLGRFRIDSDLKLKKILKIIKWLTFSLVAPLLVFLVWCSVLHDFLICALLSAGTVFFMLIDLLDIPFPD